MRHLVPASAAPFPAPRAYASRAIALVHPGLPQRTQSAEGHMQGVVTRVQVLAHPFVVVGGFGLKVLLRALLAGRGETFLDVVSRCAEEESRSDLHEIDLLRTVDRFIGFERRA